jgi:hypothetical protein
MTRPVLKKITSIYTTIAVMFFNLVLCFACMNLAIWGYSFTNPEVLEEQTSTTPVIEQITIGHLTSDFEALRQVYADLSEANMIRLIVEHANNPAICDEVVGYRTQPANGRFFKVHKAGFRQTGSTHEDFQPWPPDPEAYNVFVFGGSTTFGVNERNTGPIPVWLQTQLRQVTGMSNLYVYNFGNPSYSILEEQIRFEALVNEGFAPNLAIFIDGLNEFTRIQRVDELRRFSQLCQDTLAKLQNTLACDEDELCLPALRLYTNQVYLAEDSSADQETEVPPDDDEVTNREAVQHWIERKKSVQKFAQQNDIAVLFVIQPVPGYAYDLSRHLFASSIDDLLAGRRTYWGYPLWNEMFNAPDADWTDHVLNLSTLGQDNTEPIYVDRFHYTYWFMQEIAWAIHQELLNQHMVDLEFTPPAGTIIRIIGALRGSEISPDFTLTGWSINLDKGFGQGPGVSTISLYAGESCRGELLAETQVNLPREVQIVRMGLDRSYIPSGFEFELHDLPTGEFVFTLCAREEIDGPITARLIYTLNVK